MTKRTFEVARSSPDYSTGFSVDSTMDDTTQIGSHSIDNFRRKENNTFRVGDSEPITVLQCSFPGCLKEFNSRWSLIRHTRTHTGEKPFTCTLCGKDFIQKCSLTRHEQIHSEQKQWKCDHLNCGKKFKLKEYLDVHKRTHISAENEVTTEPVDVFSAVPENDVTYLIDQLRKRLVRQSVRHHEQLLDFNTREQDAIFSLQECASALEKVVGYIKEHRGMEIIPLDVLSIAQKYSWSSSACAEEE